MDPWNDKPRIRETNVNSFFLKFKFDSHDSNMEKGIPLLNEIYQVPKQNYKRVFSSKHQFSTSCSTIIIERKKVRKQYEGYKRKKYISNTIIAIKKF